MRILKIILVCLAALSLRCAAENGGILLASDGNAAQPIIVSENASDATKAVARELGQYLERISGARFDVKSGDGSSGIVIGTLADFPDPELEKPLEVRNRFDGREAYAIRTETNRLRLIGASDLGVSHAAFCLLEILGCRWFFPAPEWEVIPKAATLRAGVNETDRPAILARRIWYGYGQIADGGANEGRSARDYQAWARHNRMASSFVVYASHSYQTIIGMNKELFKAHPEYLAWVKGERTGEQLCVSNPAVQQLVVDHALNYFRRNPGADMVSVEPSDGAGHCECENCRKLGKVSNQVFTLANIVAKAVAKEFPGKMAGLYAYNEHSEPPDFDLEPNVYVQLTAGFTTGQYTFDELLELWPKRCKNMGFYEYFSVWLWDFDRLPGGRAANVRDLRDRIERYVAHGTTSLDCESGNNWGPHGRGYYVANKLMWNPKADVDALLADFHQKAFGPAAEPMRRYYERLDPGAKPLLSRDLLAHAFRDVEEASRLAEGRSDVLARLDDIKHYLRYVHLRWMLDREKDAGKKKALTLEIFKHAWRTRYTYMNHWQAILSDWTPKAAKEFNEPGWSPKTPGTKPWEMAQPYTQDETEKSFREGLEYFQPQPVAERAFSNNLVAVGFGGPAAVSRQTYQGALRYVFYSVSGEALRADVAAGTIAWFRDRAPARYKLLSETEETLNAGNLPLDGEDHRLEFKVPRAGLYYFDFNDSGAGWRIKAEESAHEALPLLREHGYRHAGHMQEMYFYVPRGARTIDYFWEGGTHRLHKPDKSFQEITTSGEFVSIPVPQGMDGAVWSFSQLALGHLYFFNVPNVLAASPQMLLVPRELAKEDGLKVLGGDALK